MVTLPVVHACDEIEGSITPEPSEAGDRQSESRSWIDGLTTKQRILFGTRIFDILSIDNRGSDDREMVVLCEEKV